ncbi:MAG: CoA transferase, partial [Gammaproteobacteria bacterium]
TSDGALFMVGAFKENPLREICKALEIEDLSAEERFADLDRQKASRSALQARFRTRFAEASTAHWLDRLEGVDILCAPVKSLAEALADPQTAVNQMIVELSLPGSSPVRVIGSPIDMAAAPLEVRQAPPKLGEHTAAILAELGIEQSATQ